MYAHCGENRLVISCLQQEKFKVQFSDFPPFSRIHYLGKLDVLKAGECFCGVVLIYMISI